MEITVKAGGAAAVTFYLQLAEKTWQVTRTPDGAWQVTENGGSAATLQANVIECAPGVLSLLLDGRSHTATLDRDAEGERLVLDGESYPVRTFDPRSLASRRAGARAGSGPATLKSPMPGRVVRILKQPGDAVAAKEGVLVVEAMKMQNEIKSPRAGTVSAIHVTTGDTVSGGQSLATVI